MEFYFELSREYIRDISDQLHHSLMKKIKLFEIYSFNKNTYIYIYIKITNCIETYQCDT